MKQCDIVISDVHIGSPVSRADILIKVLKDLAATWEVRRLIINGDLFNDLAFTRLTKEDWKLLSYFRKLSKLLKIIWVEGNHDTPSCDVVAHLLGIELCNEYEWKVNNIEYLAIHGHRFDDFIRDNPIITNLASAVYFTLQLMDKKTHRFSRFVKRASKKWLKLDKEITNKAIAYGIKKNKNIICGHTHMVHKVEGKINYYNGGCWTDIPSNFLLVDDNGVHIYDVDKQGEYKEKL